MKPDELISAWKAYGKKLDATLVLQDKIVRTVIRERVSNRFSGLRRKYAGGILWLLIWLALSVTVLLTNPFDYESGLQFVPMGILAICLAILSGKLIHTFAVLGNIAIAHHSVDESLKRAIALYERPDRFIKYTLVVMVVTQTILFPLSFLPKHLARSTPGEAILHTLIPMMVSGTIFFIAYKAGVFKDRDKESFRKDLDELNDFQNLASQR